MDLMALVLEKKKKALENNKAFQKATNVKGTNSGNHKMPMRKAGRGKQSTRILRAYSVKY